MHAYHEAARPVRLLAALAAGAAALAALTPGRPGRWSRAAAATAAGALVGRWLARPLARPGGRTDDGAGPPRPVGHGRDELRLWVAAADPTAPVTDPLSR